MILRHLIPRPHKSASFQLCPTSYSSILHVLHTTRNSNNSIYWCNPSRAFDNHHNRCSSSSSKRWQNRQGKDKFSISAKVQGLKSRAAFKLLEVCLQLRCVKAYDLTQPLSLRSTRNTKSFAMGKLLSIWSVIQNCADPVKADRIRVTRLALGRRSEFPFVASEALACLLTSSCSGCFGPYCSRWSRRRH